MKAIQQIALLLGILLCAGCARLPVKSASEAMRATHFSRETWVDELDLAGLSKALDANLIQLDANPERVMSFGAVQISARDYGQALRGLREKIDYPDQGRAFQNYLKENFEVHEVYGTEKGWGQVFVTSYFTPVLQGSLKKTKSHTSPVLPTPKDLIRMPMNAFAEIYPALRETDFLDVVRDGVLRGRVEEGVFVPYFARAEIRDLKKTSFPLKPICYLDPVDHFFLQIQGSGKVILPDGRILYLNYAEQNGHPYFPIGRALTDVIPLEEMSLQRIREHLRSLSEEEKYRILDLNPSYIFFTESQKSSLTSFGVQAQTGRTIATDSRFFPKGALAYLIYPHPDDPELGGRFVLDHDTGGAIRGTGRVDLFWGEGDWAEEVSGPMKGQGRLYYFVPKPDAGRR